MPGKKKGEKKRGVCAKSLVFFAVAPNGLGSNDAPPIYDYFAALRARLGRLQKREFCPKGEGKRDPDSSANLAVAVAPTATPSPTPPPIDRNAQVIVFGYHRFEKKVRRPDTEITPEMFEAQMQELKDKDIAVIGMQDFLAWKRGEKAIPPKCGHHHVR